MTSKLLRPEDVFSRLDPDRVAREIEKPLLEAVEEITRNVAKSASPGLWEAAPEALKNLLIERIKGEAPGMVRQIMTDIKRNIRTVFDLKSNRLRPDGWTSADAAGLPIFPGLVRYDEAVELGEIRHALRFTVRKTQRAYVLPATHFASRSKDANLPPMGLRVRLKADYDITKFPKTAQVILTCLKKYGMFLADNGSDWFVTGTPDNRWIDDELHTLKRIKGHDLECVDTGELRYE